LPRGKITKNTLDNLTHRGLRRVHLIISVRSRIQTTTR